MEGAEKRLEKWGWSELGSDETTNGKERNSMLAGGWNVKEDREKDISMVEREKRE